MKLQLYNQPLYLAEHIYVSILMGKTFIFSSQIFIILR